jgi:ammonia channel protein AmtB
MWPVAIILILLSLFSLIAIFLFKNRKIQLIIAAGVIIMSAGLIIALAWYGFNVISDFKMNLAPGISITIPFLILVFSVLAYRGILKDDRLVKSYDRLR